MAQLSKNAQKLLEKRYLLRDPNGNLIEHNWEDLCKRVSTNIAGAETTEDAKKMWQQIFFDKLSDQDFIPSSPCLFNAGTTSQQLSSCFVVDVEDNIEGIFSTVAECAKIFQMSGGAGFSMAKIRPKGSLCKSSGSNASGVVSFMRIFNSVVNEVKQGNKRNGALKIDLPVSHPEIYDFVRCKDNTAELNNMNISVSLTTEFIEAVENDSDWPLVFDGTTYEIIKAKDLWNEIQLHAWKTGEPGISYQTNMNNGNMNPHLSKDVYGNPCFTGDMTLLTKDGYKTFRELVNKEIEIINIDGDISTGKVWCSGIKDIVKINLWDNKSITCTDNHVFMTTDGEEVQAKDLKGKRIMPFVNHTRDLNPEYIKYGFIQGDGNLTRLDEVKYPFHDGLEVNVSAKDIEILELFNKDKYTYSKERKAIYLHGFNDQLKKMGFDNKELPNRQFPKTFDSWSLKERASFLCGCYTANGSIISDSRISYKTTSKQFAEKLVEALQHFCINAYITVNKAKEVEFPNGTYECKESYDVNIASFSSMYSFSELIGFYYEYKNTSLRNTLIACSPTVRSVKQTGTQEEVYDFSEPLKHWGVVDGFIAHNCHEFVNIPYSSCNLASINLVKVVKFDKKLKKKVIDWDLLKDNIAISVRFLDNMISVNNLPLKKIKDVTMAIRPIGLGTMALADMLFELGIPYDSQKCLEFVDKLYSSIYQYALEANMTLAKERGVYPAWEGSKWKEKGIKVRNSCMLSIAPNGSIAFIANINGGIEPVFALVYTRIDNENNEYFVVTPAFEQYLKDNDIYSDKLLERIGDNMGSIQGMDDIFPKEIQRIFVTASDVSPEWHVKVLAAIQKHVCLSISKTVNLPSTASIEDVGRVYIEAAKLGIKGITVYRDGSRDSQVLVTSSTKMQNNVTKEVSASSNQIPRGIVIDASDDLEGRKRKLVTGCGSLHCQAFFDPDTGELSETYLSKGSTGGCNNFMIAVSRLISTAARGGIPLDVLADQLHSCGACPSYVSRKATKGDTSRGSCCPSAIGYALLDMHRQYDSELLDEEIEEFTVELKNSLTDKETSTKQTKKTECPTCQSPMLFVEGCVSCQNCGYSKCG